MHCIKSARIQSYSGLHFPTFGLNTERYPISLLIQTECGKMRTRKIPNTDIFHAVMITTVFIGLKKDLGPNLSVTEDWASFLKWHISRNLLPNSSNSIFNFERSILYAIGTNFKPLDKNEIFLSCFFAFFLFVCSRRIWLESIQIYCF